MNMRIFPIALKRATPMMVLVALGLALASCRTAVPAVADPGDEQAQPLNSADASALASDYRLGPGDEIDISVWRRQELNRSVVVDPSGMITIPLAGQVRVQGLTVEEVRQTVTDSLRKFYVNPVVDVAIAGARSRRAYVFGEVMAPGPLMLTRAYRVWEGVLESGGFNNDANEKNVILVRTRNGVPEAEVLTLDVGSVIRGRGGDGGPALQDGDIVFVPQKFIADVEDFMTRLNNLVQPVTGVERGIILGDDAWKILKGTDDGSDGVVIAQ